MCIRIISLLIGTLSRSRLPLLLFSTQQPEPPLKMPFPCHQSLLKSSSGFPLLCNYIPSPKSPGDGLVLGPSTPFPAALFCCSHIDLWDILGHFNHAPVWTLPSGCNTYLSEISFTRSLMSSLCLTLS